MKVVVVERPTAQITAADLVLAVGPAGLPKERSSLFSLTLTTTFYGTSSASQHQIFVAFEDAMADFMGRVGEDYMRYEIRAPKAKFDDALSMLADVAIHPTFPAQQVERERQSRLGYAARDADNVQILGRRALALALLGPSHPYSRFAAAPTKDLDKTKPADAQRLWREAFQPGLATLVVVGNVDAAATAARADALFSPWKAAGAAPAQPAVPPAAPVAARLLVVDRPGEPRSTVLYGGAIPPRAAPDYVAALVASTVFGGMRSGELARQLRDELGATSEDTASYAGRRGPGASWVEASVAKDKTAAVLAAFDGRARQLRERGPSTQELAAAKARVAGGLPRAMETAGGLADLFASIPEYGLPQDMLSTFAAAVDAVSADDIRRLTPPAEQMRAVVVGDWAELRASLIGLGWGTVDVRDADGAPAKPR
jgi:zinc protease